MSDAPVTIAPIPTSERVSELIEWFCLMRDIGAIPKVACEGTIAALRELLEARNLIKQALEWDPVFPLEANLIDKLASLVGEDQAWRKQLKAQLPSA